MSVTATIENAVRRASEPSQLKITDIRVATIRAQGIHPILRSRPTRASTGWARCATAPIPIPRCGSSRC